MSYPLILIGAGASFDYILESQFARNPNWKPPLTKDLFDVRFNDFFGRFPFVQDLVATVITELQHDKDKDFESILLSIQNKAKKNPERKKQLIDLLFYLHALFKTISDNFGKQTGNNYSALIQQIKDSFGKACIVTFNYDLLLEQALGILSTGMDSYTSSDIKLIKAHGSCDWVYAFDDYIQFSQAAPDPREFLIKNPDYIEKHMKTSKRTIFQNTDYLFNNKSYYPAVAIPLPGKSDFVCPNEHINVLKNCLPEIDRIICIGWRANDQHMIDLIKEKVHQPIKLFVVAASEGGIEHVFNRFSNLKNITPAGSYKGFSPFMGSKQCKEFFETN